MLYLDYELLTSDRIIAYVVKNKEILNTLGPKHIPSKLEQLQRKLRGVFFDDKITNMQIIELLPKDLRFRSYPRLREILTILLSIRDPREMDEALDAMQAIKAKDWTSNFYQFYIINAIFQYFDMHSEGIIRLFNELTHACRIQIIFKEKNNTEYDDLAYNYAYRLMVLFLNPSEPIPDKLYQWIHDLMKSAIDDIEHPLHEVLQVKLNHLPPAFKILDIQGWRKFIIKEKVNALPFFNEACKIEENNHGMAPITLKEAKNIFLRCRYRRFEEDPEFAKLCYQYKVPETIYNLCLDYLSTGWPKKLTDSIPDVLVAGEEDAQGLFWLKLPVQDKRALILGFITGCCQSIGGNAEQCVKDAVSLDSNALYILVKRKKTKDACILIDHQVNDKNFEILGQSYVWKTSYGNLCLDSLELLKRNISIESLRTILLEFSQKIFALDSRIRSLTLGQGGKTPCDIFPPTSIIENMREGTFYGDAYLQYCISRKSLNLRPEHQRLKEIFYLASEDELDYLCVMSLPKEDGFFEMLDELFLTGPRSIEYVTRLKTYAFHNIVIQVLIALFHKKLFNEELVSTVMFHSNLSDILYLLKDFEFSALWLEKDADAYFKRAVFHERPRSLILGIFKLKQYGILEENLDIIAGHSFPEFIADEFIILNESKILEKNRELIVLCHYPLNYANNLVGLHQLGILEENRKYILAHHDPSSFVSVLVNLHQSGLLVRNKLMILTHTNLKDICSPLSRLKLHSLLTQKNFEAIIQHTNPQSLSFALCGLNEAGFLNDTNRSILMSHDDPDELTDETFQVLVKFNLLTAENFAIIAQHINVPNLDDKLFCLQESGLLNCFKLKEHFNLGQIYQEEHLLKFPKIAQNYALKYLKFLALSPKLTDFKKVKKFIDDLNLTGTLQPIWDDIQQGVRDALSQEFINIDHITDYLEKGRYLKSPNLSELESQLSSFPGFQAFLEEKTRLSLHQQRFFLRYERYSLWGNLPLRSQQQDFDKRFGLVIVKPS